MSGGTIAILLVGVYGLYLASQQSATAAAGTAQTNTLLGGVVGMLGKLGQQLASAGKGSGSGGGAGGGGAGGGGGLTFGSSGGGAPDQTPNTYNPNLPDTTDPNNPDYNFETYDPSLDTPTSTDAGTVYDPGMDTYDPSLDDTTVDDSSDYSDD